MLVGCTAPPGRNCFYWVIWSIGSVRKNFLSIFPFFALLFVFLTLPFFRRDLGAVEVDFYSWVTPGRWAQGPLLLASHRVFHVYLVLCHQRPVAKTGFTGFFPFCARRFNCTFAKAPKTFPIFLVPGDRHFSEVGFLQAPGTTFVFVPGPWFFKVVRSGK